MNGVTCDTGALVAADHNDRRMWALHVGFLALCTTEPLVEDQAKAVGALAARAGHDDIVDVAIVEGAVRRRDAVATSNPTHIRKIADAVRARLTIGTV